MTIEKDEAGNPALADHRWVSSTRWYFIVMPFVAMAYVLMALQVLRAHPNSPLITDPVMVGAFALIVSPALGLWSSRLVLFPTDVILTKRGVVGWLLRRPPAEERVQLLRIASFQMKGASVLIMLRDDGHKYTVTGGQPSTASFKKLVSALREISARTGVPREVA